MEVSVEERNADECHVHVVDHAESRDQEAISDDMLAQQGSVGDEIHVPIASQ